MNLLLQLTLNALINGSVMCLFAVGFGLAYRSLRFFYIAFGAVCTISVYTSIMALQYLDLSTGFSIIIGILSAAVAALLFEKTVFLPLDRARAGSAVLFVASLGIYIVCINTIALIFGNDVKMITRGVEPSFGFADLVITRIQVIQFAVGWLCVVGFWLIIRRSRFFKGIWSMGETPDLVIVLGLPYKTMRSVIFAVSALFAGIASLLTALDVGVDPYVGMEAVLAGAVAVLVGGVEVYWGWIGGAFLIAFLQSIAVWHFSAKWGQLITFGVLIITLLFRPQGLFSPKKRREER